ncbi:MAG TPA: prolyl oligopeptidase family serine peptidase [Solirubrobacteraceae bacterium]|nr:prolyl oligopeptidase family serine peptidase [Solirubrobacteraceae bacterium]
MTIIGRGRHRFGRLLVAAILLAVAAAGCGGASPNVGRLSPNNRLGLPTGAYAGKPPIGWVLVVHGGAWEIIGSITVAETEPNADFFRAHGWATYNIDYRRGAQSLPDVLSAYDHLRATIPAGAPVCAWGASAGGNLVMLLAADRPELQCVISQAGPTDLTTIATQPAGPPGKESSVTPTELYRDYAVPLFGADHLSAWSPVKLASHIHAQLLLGASSIDPTVPIEQMREMQAALPGRTTAIVLAGARTTPLNFTHASVTAAALAAWQRAELRLLASTAARGSRS